MTHDLAHDLAGIGPATLRLLTIAAAGAHHLLLVGPPATAPALLARRLLALLPAPDPAELAPVDEARRAAGVDAPGRAELRVPHHTVSGPGLLGRAVHASVARGAGARRVWPGEVSLAHGGVLLLYGAPELGRGCVEGLADALARGHVAFGSSRDELRLPSRPLLVASADDCACGRVGGVCLCSGPVRARYHGRLAPLLPLLGLVAAGASPATRAQCPAPSLGDVRGQVACARELQARRWGSGGEALEGVRTNADAALAVREPWRLASRVGARDLALPGTDSVADRPHRCQVLAVARTIADLDLYDDVRQEHVDEAAALRDTSALARGEG